MGKTDDIRRQREQEFADRADASANATPRASKVKAAVEALEGKCSVCGKMRALSNGLIGDHQKGLGKFCAGSRKAPA